MPLEPFLRFVTAGFAAGCAEDDFAGVTAAGCGAGAFGCVPRASFDAAVAWLLTAFMVSRVFWIILGLWAEAKPAAMTETRIVVVIVIAGFIFIVSSYFFTGGPGLLAATTVGSRS